MSETNTKERLLKSGMRLFLKNGFRNAPLRRIVADAGVTTGAFYGYFKNKEELFDTLVGKTANGVTKLMGNILKEIESIPVEVRLFRLGEIYVRRIPPAVDYVLRHKDEMRLLLACSEGTKYEDLFDKVCRDNVGFIESGVSGAGGKAPLRPVDPMTLTIMISGYFSMFDKMILDDIDRDVIINSMTKIAKVYVNGLMALMLAEPHRAMAEMLPPGFLPPDAMPKQ